ncbi:MAG: hypothetical protein KR126chlam4_00778 [Candidatus Anoxychlamydiales bacterium]|nr:hypothetical protein [Candidatus Anoxychlamydiales bacterium]
MTNPLRRVGDYIGLNQTKPVKAPETSTEAKKAQAVQAVATKVEKAAEAKIEKANEPSKASKALSRVKAFSKEKSSAIVKAVKEFFTSSAKKIESKIENKQTEKEKNTFKSSLSRLSDKVFNAVEKLENIDKKTNAFTKNEQKYQEAIELLFEALSKGLISKSEFDKIMLSSEKRANRKIYVDSRYGDAFKKVNAKISYKEFYAILLNAKLSPVQKAYAKEMKDVASKFATLHIQVKDINDADKLAHDKSEAIRNLADNKEYKVFIGKDEQTIAKDLKDAIVAKLGGEKAVKKLISNVISLIKSPYDFDLGVVAQRTQKQREVVGELKNRANTIANRNKGLKQLEAQKNAFRKEKQDLLSSVTDPTRQVNADRRKEVANIIAEIDAEIKEINAEKARIAQEIKSINDKKPQVLEQLRFAHLSDLNAQRRELGKLIDSDLNDIKTLPRNKTMLDTVKRYGKNTALYAGIPTAVIVGAGAGYYLYSPVAAKAAYTAAKTVAETKAFEASTFVASKAVNANNYLVANFDLAKTVGLQHIRTGLFS